MKNFLQTYYSAREKSPGIDLTDSTRSKSIEHIYLERAIFDETRQT